jgi:hypothetical protein
MREEVDFKMPQKCGELGMMINSKQSASNRTDVAQRQALTAGLQECPDRCLARILWVYDAAMASPRDESDLIGLLGDSRFDFLVDPTGG